jgi:hypothetical protein
LTCRAGKPVGPGAVGGGEWGPASDLQGAWARAGKELGAAGGGKKKEGKEERKRRKRKGKRNREKRKLGKRKIRGEK